MFAYGAVSPTSWYVISIRLSP